MQEILAFFSSAPFVAAIGVLASLFAIVGAVWAFLKWGVSIVKSAYLWVINFLHGRRQLVPRETVRMLHEPHHSWWALGRVRGRPAMQISGDFYGTNITDRPIVLLRAYISNPHTEGNVAVRESLGSAFGLYEISPGVTTSVSADFWIQPPVRKKGDDFVTSVVFIDQYGNRHKVKKVLFRGRMKRVEIPKAPCESMHSITDPIEKEVVAVLKVEKNRYEECGRRVGGLGSIQTTIRGNTYKGIGTEWREADSPKNQSIVEDESEVIISSDNAKALLNLYVGLTEEEKKRFCKMLLDRLSRETEYAPVGYLILYILFQVGMLNEALDKARVNLQGDSAYGFSDLLRFLDGLLRFRHASFSSEMLDNIERLTENVNDHCFRIPERIAAIRAFRLARERIYESEPQNESNS